MKTSKVLPATSVPPPAAFAGAYDKLAEKTNEILAISLTSKLSGTYQVALQAAGLMKRQCHVEVLDSQWAIMAQGFITIAAAKAAQSGASLDEVLDVARDTIGRVDIYVLPLIPLNICNVAGPSAKRKPFLVHYSR